MDRTEETPRGGRDDVWEQVGRAAEDFARRVARDAGRFAERLQEHSSELAGDLSREWRRSRRRHHRHHDRARRCATSSDDVRRVFDDVRGLVADVLDGIDELITTVFQRGGDEPAAEWARVVSNREVDCGACGLMLAVGEEILTRRAATGIEYRCLACESQPRPSGDSGAGPESSGNG